MAKIEISGGDTESVATRLDRMKNTPLGELDAEDAESIVKQLLQRDRDVQTVVDVARFGSSI